MNTIKSISLIFPIYNDKNTVEIMITKSLKVLKKLKKMIWKKGLLSDRAVFFENFLSKLTTITIF